MEGKTVEQLRAVLITRWEQIGKNVERGRELERETATAEMGAGQAEIIDIAQNLEQLGRDTSLAEQERRELQAIERALAKMAQGNFGICEECGESIPTKRLEVLPEARLCANCQAYEERQSSRVRLARTG